VGTYQGLIPADGQGVEILLQRVPEAKHGKNRLHLDLRTPDLDCEVRRVVGIGASLLTSQPVQEFGWRWHILGDPDGNEFCVIQPPDDYRPSAVARHRHWPATTAARAGSSRSGVIR
jgi:predicted enzyme related to lactoylglutathione lyase